MIRRTSSNHPIDESRFLTEVEIGRRLIDLSDDLNIEVGRVGIVVENGES